jgi:DNA topoisomerase VI subunit B
MSTTTGMEVITTSRLLDCIGSKEEWQRQSGYSIEDSPLAVAKELIDNALDACEETDVPPVISVKLDDTGMEVSDNGPGIAQTTIEAMLDFGMRTSSRAGRCSISRGQQGNGGQACLALPFVLDGEIGRVDIASHDVLHEITVSVNRIAGKPVITDDPKGSLVKNGTIFKLWIPSDMWISDDEKKAEFLQVAENFGWCNPHLTLHAECFGERRDILPTAPAWHKFRPSDAEPPHWYSPESFERRAAACIASDLAKGKDRLLSEFVGGFRGLSSTAKQRELWNATGLSRRPLSALLNGNGLQRDLTTRLYQELLKRGKAVKPVGLGIIGRSHIAAKLSEYACDMETFKYGSRTGEDDGGVPFVVEMAFAECPSGRGRIVRGVNFSAMIGDPFDEFYPYTVHIHDGSPVVLFVHVTRPAIQSTDRGKAHVVLGNTIQEAMNDLLEKVGKDWHKRVLAKIREDKADEAWEERETKKDKAKEQRDKKQTLRELVLGVMLAAVVFYREKFGDIIWERQLYYLVRNRVIAIDKTKAGFSQQTFKTILKEYQKKHGEIEGLSNKPRGVFIEPHSGRRLPLGTIEVAKYIVPDYEYQVILLVEKQGFEELLNKHQLAQRYDIGIIYDEGYSAEAGKALALACQAKGIRLYVLHDTDPAGYVIFDALRRNGDEPNGLDPVDISFTMEECLAMGKVPEVDYRCHALAACILPLLTPKTLQVFTGKKIVTTPEIKKSKGWKKPHQYCWEYGRIELNDLACNPRQFVREIEKRLREHGLNKKLIPPVSAMKQHAFRERDSALHDAASRAIHDALDIDAMVASVVKKLKPQVKLNDISKDLSKWAKKLLPESWKDRIAALINERIDKLQDAINELAADAIEDR